MGGCNAYVNGNLIPQTSTESSYSSCVGKLGIKAILIPLTCRYSQHVAHCAQCQEGLATVRNLRTAARAVAALATALGLLAAAITAVAALMGVNGGLTNAAMSQTALTTTHEALNSSIVWLLRSLFGNVYAADASALLSRAAAYLAVAVAGRVADAKLELWERKFYTGDYPPMRNTARD